jgi:hypothetical protein
MIAARRLGTLWRRGRWVALSLVVLAVVVRLSLPALLRKVVASKASEALRARVDVGGVELSLWRGRLGLRDVAVYPPGDAVAADGPLIGWKLLEAEISYRALAHKLVQLREVVLEMPRIALDRLADGQLNLQALLPVPAPTPPAAQPLATPAGEPKPAAPSPPHRWRFGVDHLVLRGGGVRFRDLVVPESEPLEAEIPAIEIAAVAFQPGLYEAPARIVVDVRSEGSRLRVDAKLRVEVSGIGVDAEVEATNLPLRRARVYVAGVGWSDLSGLADATLRYQLATETRNELRGTLTLRDLAVRTPGLSEPALAWQRLEVRLEPVDLLARKAMVSLVDLKGASVAATLRGRALLPLLASRREEAAPAPSPPPQEVTKPEPPSGKPWQWSVGELRIEGSKLVLDRPGSPLAVAVRLSARDLASDPGAIAKVDLGLTIGAGKVDGGGRLRLSPPAFGGTLRCAGLDVRELIPAVPSLPQALLRSATLGGELMVEAGIDAQGKPASGDSLRLRGKLGVDKLRVSAADPRTFDAGWRRLAVVVDDARVPGILAAAAAPRPIDVALGKVEIDDPWATLTRTAAGIVLPQVSPPQETAAKAPGAEPGQPPARGEGAPRPQVRIASLALRGGRVMLVDRTVKPFFSGEVKAIAVEARNLVSKGPAAESVHLSAIGFQQGKLEVSGVLRATGDGTVQINGNRIALPPFNPYVSAVRAYRFGRGSLSIVSKVVFTRDHYDTQNHLTAHELALEGGEGDTPFLQEYGIPLTTALALLTDLHGDVHIDVPVVIDKGVSRVDLGSVIASALRGATFGAITSPLKIVGAVAGLGSGSSGLLEPQPVPALAGLVEPTPEGLEQIGKLADLLASRPSIGLDLRGQVGEADLRWLREQALRAKLEAGPGIIGAVAGLPTRRARKRILEALVDRRGGKPGDLSPEDGARMEEWLKEIPEPSADEIRRLADERAKHVAALLREEHGIDERRLRAAASESRTASDAKPGVAVTIGLPSS